MLHRLIIAAFAAFPVGFGFCSTQHALAEISPSRSEIMESQKGQLASLNQIQQQILYNFILEMESQDKCKSPVASKTSDTEPPGF